VSGRRSLGSLDNRKLRLLNQLSSRSTFSSHQHHPNHDEMSSDTRTIDGANHVVLGSMHDDKATKCWLKLLRHGVAFRIDASVDDLDGTPLHHRWQTLFENEDPPGMTIEERIDRMEQVSNLLVETSLPVLQDLAPEIPYDRSLRRCYHTPTYYLRLVRDSASQEVRTSVTRGPVDESPYGYQAAKEDDLGAFDVGLKQHSSGEIKYVATEEELSRGPTKVETLDGAVHRLLACTQDRKRLGTDYISNHSRDAMRTYLQLHRNPLEVPGTAAVSGLVVDDDAFVGLLLQDVQSAGNLASHLNAIATAEHLETARRLASGWHARISSVVAALHDRGYYIHDEISEFGIDESTGIDESNLFVDADNEIWLPLSQISQQSEGVDRSSELVKKDDDAVRQVFEQYVPEKLTSLEAAQAFV
jgi:hypothetical protein